MKKAFFIFFVALSIASCEEKESYPEGFIEQEEFTEIMMEVELLEAAVKQKMLDKKYPKKNVPVYYKQIFDKHGVTYTSFKNSFDWWENHPDKMAEINDSLTKKFDRLKDTIVLPGEDKVSIEQKDKK